MEEREKQGRGAGCTILCALIILAIILPALYVLSCGPTAWLLSHIKGGDAVFNRIYEPLRIIEGTGLHQSLMDYIRWWLPRP